MTPSSCRLVALVLALLIPAARTAGAQGFRSVYTRDGVDVIAVGDNGETYRSLNGGLRWTERVVGSPTLSLRDVTRRGLAMLMVGDGGMIWASADAGGNWSSTTAPSSPDLRAAAMASDLVWVVAGSGGTILRSIDAGASWNPVPSGTFRRLNALRFTDSQHGWAVGDAGILLTTANGGASWSPVTIPTQNALLSVDQSGASVWVVGAEGTAWRSTNGGASFSPVRLKLDARADVSCVAMLSPDSLWIAGGGGFVRFSADGGATWTFQQHSMHAPISRLVGYGNGVWAVNSRNRVVMSSINRGATWRLPTGAAYSYSWGTAPKYSFSGQVRGSGFSINPVYKSTLYCGLGNIVIRSRDDGETWQVAASFPANYTKCNAFIVSPKDSNIWIAALGGGTVSDKVFRTKDSGTTWFETIARSFGEYGIPLEVDPDRPDTVWFGGETNGSGIPPGPIFRSFDFGASWDSVHTAQFRSPCDIVVVPDTTGIVIVGDGVTGVGNAQYLKSIDGGLTFTPMATTLSSEIPGMATSRLRPNAIFGTNWSAGGVQRSQDYGGTWPTVASTDQAWGIDIAKDDPNVIVFGQYSGGYNAMLSTDGGATYTAITPPSGFFNNYSFLVRDRATIFAEQSSGIWKLQPSYSYTPALESQFIQLTSPTGGESFAAGSVQSIGWTSTDIAVARIEYRPAPGDPWQFVADVSGYLGAASWTVPFDVTTEAKLRISDLWNSDPLDSMTTPFTILTPRADVTPDTLRLPPLQVGYSASNPMRIENTGTAPLTVTGIAVQSPKFWVGRTSLVLPAGESDTVGVYYRPTGPGTDTTNVTVSTDGPGGPTVLVAEGRGVVSLAAGDAPVVFALGQNRPNPFARATLIQYALSRDADVALEVFNLRGERVAKLVAGRQAAGRHEVSFGAGAHEASGATLGRIPAGMYFYRLEAEGLVATRKMLLLQ
jgi:photosystem II stability/assembly factor-like uncharacterized protein